jgi:rare lipoprotein A (RlpA)-like double-psi beta-barrel protein/putative peptidoglycan binding protein
MYEGIARSRAETEYRRGQLATPPARPVRDRPLRRPDRIALWAVVMAVVAMVAAAASAHAGSGGVNASGGAGGAGGTGRCPDMQFGRRALDLGDCGGDVKTLHWLLKAKSYGVPMDKDFDGPTDNSVRRFQRRHSLHRDGVVRRKTRKKIVRTMPRSVATWYGPGFFGGRTACGKKLRRRTIGVAHRHLPCGTRVTLRYRGRFVRARVIDRGPYTRGVRWDLTQKTARKLHLTMTDTIRAAPIR